MKSISLWEMNSKISLEHDVGLKVKANDIAIKPRIQPSRPRPKTQILDLKPRTNNTDEAACAT